VLPKAWASAPLFTDVKAVHAQEAGRGGNIRNQKCQEEYAHVTTGRMPGVMDQDLHQSKAWLANRQHLAGVMAGLSLPARRRMPIVAVVTGASC
jgi:hypothetical protein